MRNATWRVQTSIRRPLEMSVLHSLWSNIGTFSTTKMINNKWSLEMPIAKTKELWCSVWDCNLDLGLTFGGEKRGGG